MESPEAYANMRPWMLLLVRRAFLKSPAFSLILLFNLNLIFDTYSLQYMQCAGRSDFSTYGIHYDGSYKLLSNGTLLNIFNFPKGLVCFCFVKRERERERKKRKKDRPNKRKRHMLQLRAAKSVAFPSISRLKLRHPHASTRSSTSIMILYLSMQPYVIVMHCNTCRRIHTYVKV